MNPQRSSRRPHADAGFTLIEVMVALMVFAILATGVIAAANTIQVMTADSRAREYATNLASQDTDAVRQIGDPFAVESAGTKTTTTTVQGTGVFTLTRTSSWTDSNGNDVSCGSAASYYVLRVDSAVSWTNAIGQNQQVRSDTVLAPNGRINTTDSGSIAVYVEAADGTTGVAGVSVSIQADSTVSGNTAVTPATQPSGTDSDGCSYAMGLTAGTYKVSIQKTGYLDMNQASPSTAQVQVTPGATNSHTFAFDNAAALSISYAANDTTDSPVIATNQDVTERTAGGVYGPWYTTGSATSSRLFPYTAGYTLIAGQAVSCLANDPGQWPAGSVTVGTTATALSDGTTTTTAAAPGGTATAAVAMGVVFVTASQAAYLTAVEQNSTLSGNPGCTTLSTYTFGKVLKNGTVAVALPYGTWILYSGASSGARTTIVPAAKLSVATNAIAGYGVDTTANTVTLDPRSTS